MQRMRQRRRRWMAVAVAGAGLSLVGCADTAESATSSEEPAEIVEVDGSDVPQVVLTEKAAGRLGIELKPVSVEGSATVIPYAAVVYDSSGAAWAYTRPEALTFRRTPIEIVGITGERVLLSGGLDAKEVVTVGTAELFGVEQGIGH